MPLHFGEAFFMRLGCEGDLFLTARNIPAKPCAVFFS